MKKRIDLTGVTVGRLTVVEKASNIVLGGRVYTRWLCLCDCGNKKAITTQTLRAKTTKSCGCFAADSIKRIATTHGHSVDKKCSPTFSSYRSMISRCYKKTNISYPKYGGSGVVVCDQWKESFQCFLDDMGIRPKGHSIERKKNNEGYSPDNCTWATRLQQANNKSNNLRLSFNGNIYTGSQLDRLLGLSDGLAKSWHKKGITDYDQEYKNYLNRKTRRNKNELFAANR